MVRLALLGCAALAGLAICAPALAAQEGDDESALSATERTVEVPRVIRRVRRRVHVLPPTRPGDLVVQAAAEPSVSAEQNGPNQAQAADPAAAPVVVLAAAVLPPLRPALPSDVQPSAEPASVVQAEAASVEMLPPPRPEIAELPAPRILIAAVRPPQRPNFPADAEPTETGALQEPAPAPQPRSLFGDTFAAAPAALPTSPELPDATIHTGRATLDARIAHHARLNDVPVDLVHRVVVRESKYNPRAVGRGGAMGLMQIKHATARAMGYGGTAAGLLEAETNLTYAVKYLAGAYRVADGDRDGAVRNYARGYYYEAKRRVSRVALRSRSERLQRQANAAAVIDDAVGMQAPARTVTDLR